MSVYGKDLTTHQSSSSIEKLDSNFCGAFQEHYEYLMDEGLIETCQYSSGAQQFDYENMTVSFKEFLHQYNQICKWIEKINSLNYSQVMSSYCEKYVNQLFYEQMLKRSPRRQLLNEYAVHLVKYHPHLKNQVLAKLQYLNKQWKSIESSIMRCHNNDLIKDLEEDLNNFEFWLKKTEQQVDSLKFSNHWDNSQIVFNLNEHKSLQSDIESHASIINSVLKLTTRIKQLSTDYNKFHELAVCLQEKWHFLWLQSLEWQCRLEEELAKEHKQVSNVCLSKLSEQDKANILIKNHHHHHHHHTNINQTSNQTKAGISNIPNQNITNKRVTNRKPLHDQLEQLEQEEKEKLEQKENRNRSYILTCFKSPKKTKKKNKKQINKRDECTFEQSIDAFSLKIDNSFGNQHELDELYYDDEDIIPFHNCEYEKIIVVNQKSHSNKINKFLRLTKSLNNLNQTNRKMMKTSRTESEIKSLTFEDDLQSANKTYHNRSSRYSNHKKLRTSHRRSFHSLNQNDFSFYYSLTDVKYYNIDDDDDEEEEENNGNDLVNKNCSSSFDNLNEKSDISSTRSSSLSLSYSSCNRRYSFSRYSTHSSTSNKSSCSSMDLNNNSNQNNSLQKSVTLPNAVLVNRTDSQSPRSSCPDLSKSLSDFYLQNPITTQVKSNSKEKSKKKKKYSKCLYFSSNTFSKHNNQSPINLIKRALRENNSHHGASNNMNPNNNYYYNYKRKLFLHNSIKCEMNGCEADLDDDNNDEFDDQPSELIFHQPNQSNQLSFYDNVQIINHLENYHSHDCKQYQHSALMNANNAMSTNSTDNHIIKKWIEINTKSANSTSAYDTCSNLSHSNHSPNMLTSCESRSSSNSDPISTNICTTTSYSCSCSCSTSSRSACQSLSLSPKSSNSYAVNTSITNSKNNNNNKNNQMMRIQNDESVHTDVSDPHWDGYENSPYYSNSNGLNGTDKNKAIQAILPWDELFFELEPIDDTQIKVNNKSTKRLRSFKRSHRFSLHLNKGNLKRINLAFSKKQLKCVNELIKQLNNSLDELNNASRLVKSEFFSKPNENQENIVLTTHSAKSTAFINKQFNSKFRFIKCSDYVLETCHININSLASIKNSINSINKEANSKSNKRTKKTPTTNSVSTLKNKGAEFDYYLLKLDEITSKWKMLETFCENAKSFNTNMSRLMDDLNLFKSIIQHTNELIEETKTDSAYLYSINNLKLKLNELQKSEIELNNLAEKFNESRKNYERILSQSEAIKLSRSLTEEQQSEGIKEKEEPSESKISAESHVNFQLINQLGNELASLEEMYQNVSLELKIQIKNLSSFLNVWYEVENLLNNLETKLDSFKLETISKWADYGDKLNTKDQVNLSMYNELIEKINHANLDEISINIKQLKSKMQLFKQTFDSLVEESGGEKNKTFYAYQSYLNKIEKFHLQLDLMREFVSKNKPRSDAMHEEHQPALESIINQGDLGSKEEIEEQVQEKSEKPQTLNAPMTLMSKSNQTSETKNNYKLELDINKDKLNYKSVINKDEHNFQLDLHLNDSIDNSNFQMTSTPRFRHIEIENSMNQIFTSKFKHYQSNEQISHKDNLLLSKSLVDKSVKTIDEKSVQTEEIVETRRKESIEAQASKLIESLAQDDTRWFKMETPDSGILLDQIESTPIATRHLDRFVTTSPKTFTKFFRERKSVESIDGDLRPKKLVKKPKEEEEEVREEEKVELLKPRELVEEQEEQEENVIRVERWQFSPLRFLLYAFMFSLILTTVIYFLLPNIVPSCCDYKREFLIFNEKNLKDDYLPF